MLQIGWSLLSKDAGLTESRLEHVLVPFLVLAFTDLLMLGMSDDHGKLKCQRLYGGNNGYIPLFNDPTQREVRVKLYLLE